MTDIDQQTETNPPKPLWQRLLPVFVIIAILAAAYFGGVGRYLTQDALLENFEYLRTATVNNVVIALLALIAIYATGTAISFPGMTIVTIGSGVIFSALGTVQGVAVGSFGVVVGATLGATVIFLIAKSALGDSLTSRAGPFLQKFEAGFREDEFNYLLAIRMTPVFPFWLVNIAPALVGMKLRNYVLATFLGIIPAVLAYVYAGVGVGDAVESVVAAVEAGGEGQKIDLLAEGAKTFSNLIGPVIGLILVSLLPIAIKRFRKKPVAGSEA